MRLAIVQFTPTFPGRDENWKRIEAWAEGTDADVIVFPELSSCGYCYRDRDEIRPYTNTLDALARLETIARRKNRLLVGGFAESSDGELFNSAYAIDPDHTQVYRKIHLWNVEKTLFRGGEKPLLVTFRGHRFGIEICYDLQFPELASLYSRMGAEAILVPMAWAEEPVGPLEGLEVYNHLALATAFSHGIYVAVDNRTGAERGATFPGQASITDPFGRMRHLSGGEGTLEATLDFTLVRQAKQPNARNEVDSDARLPIGAPGAVEALPGFSRLR